MQGMTSLFSWVKFLIYLIYFTNDQNTMRRDFWGYIYTSTIKILCVEIFEATFTHPRLKYASKIKLETF